MRRQLSRSGDSQLRRWRRLILGLLGALLATQALTLLFFAVNTWRVSRTTSDAFVNQTIAGASLVATEQIRSIVVDFESSIQLTANLVERGVVTGRVDADTENYLLQVLRTNEVQSSAYFGFGNGDFIMASRDTSKPGFPYRLKTIAHPGGKRTVTLKWFAEDLRRGPVERDAADTFDPRVRPWYERAAATREIIWTEPYVFFSSRKPGLTVAKQLPALDGVRRIYASDFGLEKLGQFARSLKVGVDGATLVVSAGGAVIAGPGLDERIAAAGGADATLPTLASFQEPISLLDREFQLAAESGQQIRRITVGSGGRRTAASIARVPVGAGSWSVALYGPESDFAASAEANNRREFVKIIVLGLSGLLLATLLATALTRPLGGLTSSAASDGLTGLANRRELDAVARILFDRAKTGGKMLSVGILDVDEFKSVNDTHGHLIGDDVLRAVADALTSTVRREDVVGRFAGDEFVIVMPDVGGPEAEAIAQRALAKVREIAGGVAVTASAGVSTLTREIETFDELVDLADKALYRAKADGRDRVARHAHHPLG